jgi:hypothetical protein
MTPERTSQAITAFGVRTTVGSYVGTGTYGSGNAVTLTFDFEPKFVVVSVQGDPYGHHLILVNGITHMGFCGGTSSTNDNIISWGTNTVSWYNTTNASYMMNAATNYYYIAIG